MTAREFQKEFERAASYHDKLKDIRIKSTDVNYFLNEGQDTFIQRKLNAVKDGIKTSQRALDEIRDIIIRGYELTLDETEPVPTEYNRYNLPNNYLYLISDRTVSTYCSKTYKAQNRLYSTEKLNEILNGTHTQSHYKSPVSELAQNVLYVHLNDNLSFTINKVIIDYVKTYQKIDVMNDVTSELNDSVHRDIVQLAVNIFLEAVESRRFTTNLEKNITTTEQI